MVLHNHSIMFLHLIPLKTIQTTWIMIFDDLRSYKPSILTIDPTPWKILTAGSPTNLTQKKKGNW